MEARGSREYSSIKPLRSSIVRLKYYKKAVAGENEAKIKRYGNIYKHLYLLALTPDGEATWTHLCNTVRALLLFLLWLHTVPLFSVCRKLFGLSLPCRLHLFSSASTPPPR